MTGFYVFDGLTVAVAAWMLLRPPGIVARLWARRNTSRSTTGTVVIAMAFTLVSICLVVALPREASVAVRFQLLFPFLVIDLMAAAQYRAFHRQLTQP